ncbi:MAG TPA: M28 family peptidase [Pseudomonadales bacterium]
MTSATRFITVIAWLCLSAFALYRISVPPTAAALDIDDGTQQGLFAHLQQITVAPRPIASPGHDAVHDYIVAEITRLGLTPDIQQRPLGTFRNMPRWADEEDELRNIAVRLPGSGEGRALVLASHYDSAPESFGAGDDGAAVASMLQLLAEVARADFANDLIFLFTDAEENCLCGAYAFMREHPWAPDVGAVLNFEARGTSGKSVMFEATPGYGSLVRLYAEHARSPATSSLYQSVYELLPNDTDLTVFREHGVLGLNMAFIDSSENYHTANDNFANLNRDTALHHYANMRAMLYALADADLDALESPDVIFFDVFGLVVFVYDYAFAWIGAALATVLCGWLLYDAWRDGRMNVTRFAIALVLLPLATAVLIVALSAISDELIARIGPMTAAGKKFYSGTFIIGAMAAFMAIATMLQRRLGRGVLIAAILCLWLVLLVVTSIALPKVSYIFLWPLLLVLALKALEATWPVTGRATAVAAPLAYAPLVVLWTQVAFALLLALNVADMHVTLTPMLLAAALLWTSELFKPLKP